MQTIQLNDLLLLMAAAAFTLGLVTFVLGVFILVARANSRDMRTLSVQTAQLAQKGIAEDVAGLVGNASALMSAMQELVKTTAGIGVFLTTLGLGLMTVSYWLLLQIKWPL